MIKSTWRASWALLVLLPFSSATAQTRVSDLSDAIDSGKVTLVQLRGNGSSSGAALDGELRNDSGERLLIRTAIRVPLYFSNRGGASRQNMVATQVYNDDGGYLSDGSESFVELPTSSSIQVMFIAYCADFEKDNPQYSDTFALLGAPPALASAARKISEYEAAHPGQDTTVASQVALWLAQGVGATEIRDKFPFSENDLRVARQILGAN